MEKSSAMKVEDAAIKIAAMESVGEITVFVEGDERKTVKSAAGERIAELEEAARAEKPKAGETKTLTNKTPDFKGPEVQAKKHVTGEDVIRKLRAGGTAI